MSGGTRELRRTGQRWPVWNGLRWTWRMDGLRLAQISATPKSRGFTRLPRKPGMSALSISRLRRCAAEKYRASQAALRLANGDRWQDTGYLFTQDDGRPMNPTSITAWLNKFSKRRGLPHIHPHSFRHSVASILISAGTGLVTVAGQLGHTQTSTTADIYAHVVEKAKAQATECIADILLRGKRA